ncbi:type 1 glutamine amidotransferase domain-containing protein, partial [Francisella tularensis subsp. holarctica]|nr:type 1 glutamine amidotransferase domain-containing protein [Francisella tularensis subsp. holarctica]
LMFLTKYSRINSIASEWHSYVKSDSKNITAQNPQSATDFAKAIKQSIFN